MNYYRPNRNERRNIPTGYRYTGDYYDNVNYRDNVQAYSGAFGTVFRPRVIIALFILIILIIFLFLNFSKLKGVSQNSGNSSEDSGNNIEKSSTSKSFDSSSGADTSSGSQNKPTTPTAPKNNATKNPKYEIVGDMATNKTSDNTSDDAMF